MVSYVAAALLAVGAVASAPQPVTWQDNYGDALAATRADDKQPLLVVLDEPKEDGSRVEPALLGEGQPKAEETTLLKHYRRCHIDVTTKYGRRIAKAFRAKRFPHVAIIDKSGKVILYKKSGQIDEKEWTSALKSHQDGNRVAARQASYQTNGDANSSANGSKSYCPYCQRNSL
jgi:hypothetical protein